MSKRQIFGTPNLPSDSLVPIRTVSSLTGVTPVTLRAWERRYSLIRPTRTPKGHRLYTMTDVDLINQVVTLLDSGMSISQVKRVLQKDANAPTIATTPSEDTNRQSRFDLWHNYQQRLLDAIHRFDENRLNDSYNEILSLYPVDIVTSRLLVPLLKELGWRWQRGKHAGVAEEHFFSVFLRNKLGTRLHHSNRHLDGPHLIAACLPGEQHDVGLMLFTLVALDWNYRVILLGANTPLLDLPVVAQRSHCHGIVLAGSGQPSATVLNPQLCELIDSISIPVFVGGRVISRCGQVFRQLGITLLHDDFQQAMRTINSHLRPKIGIQVEQSVDFASIGTAAVYRRQPIA